MTDAPAGPAIKPDRRPDPIQGRLWPKPPASTIDTPRNQRSWQLEPAVRHRGLKGIERARSELREHSEMSAAS